MKRLVPWNSPYARSLLRRMRLPIVLGTQEIIRPEYHPWILLGFLLRTPSRILDSLTSAHHRYLDNVIARITQNRLLFPHGFFSEGWGDMSTPLRLWEYLAGDRPNVVHELNSQDIHWDTQKLSHLTKVKTQQGYFRTTVPEAEKLLPEESLIAHFELVTPLSWSMNEDCKKNANSKPMVVLLPGTGDHGFAHRRTSVAIPLAQKGIASLILEGPYYGRRRPKNQRGSKLRRVSDLPTLGQATIEETKSLMQYFRDHHNFSRFVVAGSSMGGLHAAMTASVYPGDCGAVAWVAPPSAIPVFTHGLLSHSCNWKSLSKHDELQKIKQLYQNHRMDLPLMQQITQNPEAAAKERMNMFLAITNIENFRPPKRTDAVAFVVGIQDQYIPAPEWMRLQEKWCGARFEYLNIGHVSGILLEQAQFRELISQKLDKLREPEA